MFTTKRIKIEQISDIQALEAKWLNQCVETNSKVIKQRELPTELVEFVKKEDKEEQSPQMQILCFEANMALGRMATLRQCANERNLPDMHSALPYFIRAYQLAQRRRILLMPAQEAFFYAVTQFSVRQERSQIHLDRYRNEVEFLNALNSILKSDLPAVEAFYYSMLFAANSAMRNLNAMGIDNLRTAIKTHKYLSVFTDQAVHQQTMQRLHSIVAKLSDDKSEEYVVFYQQLTSSEEKMDLPSLSRRLISESHRVAANETYYKWAKKSNEALSAGINNAITMVNINQVYVDSDADILRYNDKYKLAVLFEWLKLAETAEDKQALCREIFPRVLQIAKSFGWDDLVVCKELVQALFDVLKQSLVFEMAMLHTKEQPHPLANIWVDSMTMLSDLHAKYRNEQMRKELLDEAQKFLDIHEGVAIDAEMPKKTIAFVCLVHLKRVTDKKTAEQFVTVYRDASKLAKAELSAHSQFIESFIAAPSFPAEERQWVTQSIHYINYKNGAWKKPETLQDAAANDYLPAIYELVSAHGKLDEEKSVAYSRRAIIHATHFLLLLIDNKETMERCKAVGFDADIFRERVETFLQDACKQGKYAKTAEACRLILTKAREAKARVSAPLAMMLEPQKHLVLVWPDDGTISNQIADIQKGIQESLGSGSKLLAKLHMISSTVKQLKRVELSEDAAAERSKDSVTAPTVFG